jgi:hypothetical protein
VILLGTVGVRGRARSGFELGLSRVAIFLALPERYRGPDEEALPWVRMHHAAVVLCDLAERVGRCAVFHELLGVDGACVRLASATNVPAAGRRGI